MRLTLFDWQLILPYRGNEDENLCYFWKVNFYKMLPKWNMRYILNGIFTFECQMVDSTFVLFICQLHFNTHSNTLFALIHTLRPYAIGCIECMPNYGTMVWIESVCICFELLHCLLMWYERIFYLTEVLSLKRKNEGGLERERVRCIRTLHQFWNWTMPCALFLLVLILHSFADSNCDDMHRSLMISSDNHVAIVHKQASIVHVRVRAFCKNILWKCWWSATMQPKKKRGNVQNANVSFHHRCIFYTHWVETRTFLWCVLNVLFLSRECLLFFCFVSAIQ